MSTENFDKDFDTSFQTMFDQNPPNSDSQAKNVAINQALESFSQGIDESSRPIDNRENWFSIITQSIGRFFMNTTNKPLLSNNFASIAVAFIAISVVLIIPNLGDEPGIRGSTSPNVVRNDKRDYSVLEEVTVTASKQSSIDKNRGLELAAGDIVNNQIVKSKPSATSPPTESLSKLGEHLNPVAAARPEQNTKSLNSEAFGTGYSADDLQSFTASSTPQHDSLNGTARIKQQPIRPDANEEYAQYQATAITQTVDTPISTFSIDVDTASYSLVRNQLNRGFLPKTQAVRAEELINYFDYQYALPLTKDQPFKPTISVLDSPWNKGKKLIHIGIKGYDIAPSKTPDSNLVFLLDVSGSMNSTNKLPLVKQSINLLLDTLKPSDTVSIVVYAGAAGMVLEPTKVEDKRKILDALQRLNAGGSTAGGAGIELAYNLAEQNFNEEAVNRIILATDGDFNVGQSRNLDLKTLVERKRDKGVFLSVLGFGRNNYQDDMMQTLAQNGNGVAAYIDSLSEAKKVLVDEATSTLFTIAKDVKLQVEFNPSVVSEYRLIGYETRALKREDFNNDKVDAGDIGAGHTVTAIYEVTLASAENQSVDPTRYAQNKADIKTTNSNEMGFLKIRYKAPTGSKSKLIEQVISNDNTQITSETNFSVAVAGFAQLLANNQYSGNLTYDDIIKLASQNKGDDKFGYRSEFIQLVRMAKIAQP